MCFGNFANSRGHREQNRLDSSTGMKFLGSVDDNMFVFISIERQGWLTPPRFQNGGRLPIFNENVSTAGERSRNTA